LVDIHENYRDYVPPSWVRATVERLMASLTAEHVGNLEAIVLTNSARVPKGKTNRVAGRKYQNRECLGFYHPATSQGRAWIELVVNNIVTQSGGRRLPSLNMVRDLLVGMTLYHEIGHHLHETLGSAERGGEASADDWSSRLSGVHIHKRYGHLESLFKIFGFLLSPVVNRLAARMRRRRGTG